MGHQADNNKPSNSPTPVVRPQQKEVWARLVGGGTEFCRMENQYNRGAHNRRDDRLDSAHPASVAIASGMGKKYSEKWVKTRQLSERHRWEKEQRGRATRYEWSDTGLLTPTAARHL